LSDRLKEVLFWVSKVTLTTFDHWRNVCQFHNIKKKKKKKKKGEYN